MLVFCPSMMIERLATGDFIGAPQCSPPTLCIHTLIRNGASMFRVADRDACPPRSHRARARATRFLIFARRHPCPPPHVYPIECCGHATTPVSGAHPGAP